MLCYKDKTFCGSDCVSDDCHRNFGDKEKQGAKLWMGDDAPVAFTDFSKHCPEYKASK